MLNKTTLFFSILLYLIVSCTELLFAGHISGYDLSLLNIKNEDGTSSDLYKFRLKYYRDIKGSSVPSTFTFRIRENDTHVLVATLQLNKINPYNLVKDSSDLCITTNRSLLEYALYESVAIDLSQYNHAEGYYILASSYARTEDLKNIAGNSSEAGITMTMDFPALGSNSNFNHNSSPEFDVINTNYYCVGSKSTIRFNCTDRDNDSLVYSIVEPLAGGNDQSTKPFTSLEYSEGYSINNILQGNPDVEIDIQTGVINFTATQAGKFLIAIKVEEYRSGIKISEIRKEFEVEIFECSAITKPHVQFVSDNSKYIQKTVQVGQTLNMEFVGTDSPNENFQLTIIPTASENDSTGNILDKRNGALWGSHVDSLNNIPVIIKGKGLISGYFKWSPDCFPARNDAYTFLIVASDYTCPIPQSDTLFVSITVLGNMTHPIPEITETLDTLSVAEEYDTYQWYHDNKILLGSNSNKIIVQQTGGYFVEVAKNGFCPVKSEVVYLLLNSINLINQNPITLSPNPTSNSLTFQSQHPIKAVNIMDLQGKILIVEQSNPIHSISVSDLNEGIYLINIIDTFDNVYRYKFIKN